MIIMSRSICTSVSTVDSALMGSKGTTRPRSAVPHLIVAVGGASALVTFICVLCTLRTQISLSIRECTYYNTKGNGAASDVMPLPPLAVELLLSTPSSSASARGGDQVGSITHVLSVNYLPLPWINYVCCFCQWLLAIALNQLRMLRLSIITCYCLESITHVASINHYLPCIYVPNHACLSY
jgi:hypothetical protein